MLFYFSKYLLVSAQWLPVFRSLLAYLWQFLHSQIWQLMSESFKIIMNAIKFFVCLVMWSCSLISNEQASIWCMGISELSLAVWYLFVAGLQLTLQAIEEPGGRVWSGMKLLIAISLSCMLEGKGQKLASKPFHFTVLNCDFIIVNIWLIME